MKALENIHMFIKNTSGFLVHCDIYVADLLHTTWCVCILHESERDAIELIRQGKIRRLSILEAFSKQTNYKGSRKVARQEEVGEEYSPVAVAADEPAHECVAASSTSSGW